MGCPESRKPWPAHPCHECGDNTSPISSVTSASGGGGEFEFRLSFGPSVLILPSAPIIFLALTPPPSLTGWQPQKKPVTPGGGDSVIQSATQSPPPAPARGWVRDHCRAIACPLPMSPSTTGCEPRTRPVNVGCGRQAPSWKEGPPSQEAAIDGWVRGVTGCRGQGGGGQRQRGSGERVRWLLEHTGALTRGLGGMEGGKGRPRGGPRDERPDRARLGGGGRPIQSPLPRGVWCSVHLTPAIRVSGIHPTEQRPLSRLGRRLKGSGSGPRWAMAQFQREGAPRWHSKKKKKKGSLTEG